jgi:hypothetical protein
MRTAPTILAVPLDHDPEGQSNNTNLAPGSMMVTLQPQLGVQSVMADVSAILIVAISILCAYLH